MKIMLMERPCRFSFTHKQDLTGPLPISTSRGHSQPSRDIYKIHTTPLHPEGLLKSRLKPRFRKILQSKVMLTHCDLHQFFCCINMKGGP